MGRRRHSVSIDVDVDLDDFDTEDLIEEILAREGAAEAIRMIKKAEGEASNKDSQPIIHAFDDTVEDLRRASYRRDWAEFLHLLDRFMPRDLVGVDREIEAFYRGRQ